MTPKRGGSPVKHRKAAAPALHWDNARVFLEVVRATSFRAAAERLGESVSFVRRRINDLEREVGATLFMRDAHGTHLTDEGTEIVAAVERMEAAAFGLMRGETPSNQGTSEEVRVAISEGLGTFWLLPRLVEFQQRNPNVLVDLNCGMRAIDVLRLEADIAVQLSRPTSADVKMAKLGRLHLAFYASPSYIKTYGVPKSREDLRNHRFALQAPDPASANAIYRMLFPETPSRNLVVMRNNVSSANYLAIAKGVGIGLLPTYATVLSDAIVPLDIDFHHSFDIWLSYHPDGGRIPRIRNTIDWIMSSFNPRRYLWFADEYIPASRLPKSARRELVISQLSAFAEV